ncbi:MAG TPA: AAA family ATPase [Agriterribacter sp.]|nr:AAA family ATPase [Agriterribacter sp.]
MFVRPHLQELIQRIQEPRNFVQVVMGPRQVGKTTLVVQLAEKIKIPHHFVSADAIAATNTTWLEQQWEAARTMMDQQKMPEFLLIIDEIQKIEQWSEAVKLLWDIDSRRKRNMKVILLGSSWLLQRGLTLDGFAFGRGIH